MKKNVSSRHLAVLALSLTLGVCAQSQADDAYEENDTLASAYDFSDNEETWLATIGGMGVQADDDWYEIYVTAGEENVQVDCVFTHADGDIDILLADADGNTLARSSGTTDSESINYVVPSSGTYYIRVYFHNAGNTYNLWWNDSTPLKPYLTYNSHTISDDSSGGSDGNGDGQVNPGETVEFFVVLGNYVINNDFHADAHNVSAELSTSDTYVTITDSDENYGNIVYGDTAPCESHYIIVVAGNCPDGHVITFDLSITSDEGSWIDSFTETVHGPDDDAYEENDSLATAYDFTTAYTPLSETEGLGVQLDADWYKILVSEGENLVKVDCQFKDSDGNINIALRDDAGTVLAISQSTSDREFISYEVPSAGTYYIEVFGEDFGNTYDLFWWDHPPSRLIINPLSRSHTASAASGQTIEVDANVYWTASEDSSWIEITSGGSGTGGLNVETITYSVQANNGTELRSGDITISQTSGSLYQTFTVNQEALPAATYTVSYDANEATSGTAPSAQTKTHDETLTLASNSGNLVRTGYTFAGWNTASNGFGTDFAAGGSYTANASVKLYAKWTPITYTVTYDGNGHTGGSTASSSHTYDVSKALTANGYVKTGNTFAGWATSSGGNVFYSDVQNIANLTSAQGATVSLYAKWTPKTYPDKPTDPFPADSATNVSIDADLSWSDGGGATSYDVYFGPSGSMTSQGNQPGSTYDPTLDYSTDYSWRIDAKNGDGTTTGDIWSFTTASAPPEVPFTYTTNNGTITITGYTGSGGAVSIPPLINGLPVTSFEYRTFYSCTSLTSVTIPDSITTIEDHAFDNCTSLTSVMIGIGVTSIGYAAFQDCTSLTSVTIPNSVTSIGSYAFDNCASLVSVMIGTGVTSIGGAAFQDCTSLTSVTIPDSVTGIGGWAFKYCSGLTSVMIGTSVTTIGEWAFAYSGLTSVTIPDSVTTIGGWAFYHCDNLTSVTIDTGVTSIGERAFCYCISLTSITIPDSVTTIGEYAFNDCTNLTNITIPNSVISIGAWAFCDCDSLISVRIPDSINIIGKGAFANCSGLTSVMIGTGVTTIGDLAFYGCGSLSQIIVDALNSCYSSLDGVFFNKNKTILIQCPARKSGNYTIPDSVTTIEKYAFRECINLTSVTIPDGVITIALCTFYNCTSLTSITIPDSVTTIGDNAFEGCSGLTSVAIPDSVTAIGNSAFRYCTNLTSVTIPDGIITIASYTFYNCTSLTSITIPDSVTNIGDGAFYDCIGLIRVTIPCGITTIGEYAFRNCTSLTGVYFRGNAPGLGFGMFYLSNHVTVYHLQDATGWPPVPDAWAYRPTALCSIFQEKPTNPTPGAGATDVGINADLSWSDGVGATSYDVYFGPGGTMTSRGNQKVYAYDPGPLDYGVSYSWRIDAKNGDGTITGDVWSFTTSELFTYMTNNSAIWITGYNGSGGAVSIPPTINGIPVTTIYQAFHYCTSLTSVTIPDSVTQIGKDAFRGCTGLTSITIPDSVTSIGDGAFLFCTGLTSVIIPNSVVYIQNDLFYGCTSLAGITISDSITYIPQGMFRNCTSLTSVTIPNSVTEIGPDIFMGCSGLTSVTISDSVTSILWYGFSSCTSLTRVYFRGNAPTFGDYMFYNSDNVTVYHLEDATGWPPVPDEWAGRPTALLNPDPVEVPSVNPTNGEYTSPLNVSASCATVGATIRYTANGSEPTESSLIWVNGAVTLPATLKFKAFKSGWTASAMVTREYTLATQAILSAAPLSRSVSKDAGTTTFNVANMGSGTMPWTASLTSGATWARITSGASGTDSGTITVGYDVNPFGGVQRTAIIRVTAIGATGNPVDVTIVQADNDPDFNLPGSGTESDPYLISSKEDLLLMVGAVEYYGKHFRLTTDINLSGETFDTALIAPDTNPSEPGFQGPVFSGVFDGAGHSISNLTIVAEDIVMPCDYLGLFGNVSGESAAIRNLGVENVFISGGPYARYAGGLCGYLSEGTISGCYATGLLIGDDFLGGLCGYNSSGSLNNCHATCSVSGDDYLGGLCGHNSSGTINACYATGPVSGDDYLGGICGFNSRGAISSCYATGAVNGEGTAGGLCGYNYFGTVSGCYATGAVSGTDCTGGFCGRSSGGTISTCYSTGAVSGDGAVGGFCGRNYGTVDSCLWDVESSGMDTSHGAIGRTTAEMQMLSTFTDAGWDFSGEWNMSDYPLLNAFSAMTFARWLSLEAVPLGSRGEADFAVDDGIPNLLKYACGFSAMTSAKRADLLSITKEAPDAFSVLYYSSKTATDVKLEPIWAADLLGPWMTTGMITEIVGEVFEREHWKASIPLREKCFIKLRATPIE